MTTQTDLRAGTLRQAARITRRYSTPGGARIARVEWPDIDPALRVELVVRGARRGRTGYLADAWGDQRGLEETRATVIKDKAVEKLLAQAKPAS